MTYVFEGLSSLDHSDASLDKAKSGLDALRQDGPGFFALSPQPQVANDPTLKFFRFGELQFYSHPGRARSLCAFREVVLTDRDAFAKDANGWISSHIRTQSREALMEIIKIVNKEQKQIQVIAVLYGLGTLAKTGCTLSALAEKFDAASFESLATAVPRDVNYPFIRFDAEAVRLTLPITEACARKIVTDPATADSLKEIRALVKPAELKDDDRGLSIVLGAKGKPIHFTHIDPRPSVVKHEADLLRYAGNPDALALDPTNIPESIQKAKMARVTAGRAALKAERWLDARIEFAAALRIDPKNTGGREVRRKAADALGELGPAAKEAVPALRKAQVDLSFDVQRAARAALKKIEP